MTRIYRHTLKNGKAIVRVSEMGADAERHKGDLVMTPEEWDVCKRLLVMAFPVRQESDQCLTVHN